MGLANKGSTMASLPQLMLASTLTAYSLIVLVTEDLGGMQYLALLPIRINLLASWKRGYAMDWVMVTAHMLVFYWAGSGAPLPWK